MPVFLSFSFCALLLALLDYDSNTLVHLGYPAQSKIEQAYRQTSHTLLELGVLHASAEAAFLEVPRG
jgi:hypothetical protein